MKLMKFIIVTVIVLSSISVVKAEDIQIDIVKKLNIEYINAKLERKLKLFPEYENFIEARIFKTGDSQYSLEILYKENNLITRKKIPLNEKDLQELRTRITNKIARQDAMKAIDQEGRYTLLTFTTIYSFGLYGPLSTIIFDIDENKNIVALESLYGSIGFFLPFWLTRESRVSEGAAFSYIYGNMSGAFHGFALSLCIEGGEMANDKLISSLVLSLSLAEGIGGYYITDKYKYSPGQVDIISTGNLWASIWTFEFLFITTEMKYDRLNGAALLGGSIGGIFLGYYMSGVENYSRGDVIVQNCAILLGAYIPMAIIDLAGAKKQKVFMGGSLAGSIVGSGIGYYLVKDKEFSTGQGGLIFIGEAAGSLAGVAFAYYISPENRALYLSASSIGALAGFSIIYYIFHDKAHVTDDTSWNIRFFPAGLTGLFLKDKPAYFSSAHDNAVSDMIPVISLEFKF